MTGVSGGGPYKWIMHVKDHFSKYSALYALENETSKECAKAMLQWLGRFGLSEQVRCDNGGEFQGEFQQLLIFLKIKITHGNLYHPEAQGLVEQANGVVKMKLAARVITHPNEGSVHRLPYIMLSMNRQAHSTLASLTPYKVFFGRKPIWQDQ